MFNRIVAVLVVSAGLFLVAGADAASPGTDDLLKSIGVSRGVCAIVGDPKGDAVIDLARASELTILAQVPAAADLQTVSAAADAAGLLGQRVFVAVGKGRVGLADNLADAVVVLDGSIAEAELLRVLRPGGKALSGKQTITKPSPAGIDDWSHHYHGPDNNPQSADTLARAPFMTQFVVEPRYAPAPQAAVAAGGRIFMAFGHVAWHKREEPWLNTLLAVDAFNGTQLWRRPLASGIMVDRSTMVATSERLYLAEGASCKVLDAATGKPLGELTAPDGDTQAGFWKWMALVGDTLYALVGDDEPADSVARWNRTGHGWPWNGISTGYNQPAYEWGFGRTLLAMDPKTGKVRWSVREEKPIDSRALCTSGGRIFYGRFGEYLVCLNAADGKPSWRRTAEKDAELFKAVGPYRAGHGYIGGWKSTVYLKCDDKAVYFLGPQVERLTAVSAEAGELMWTYPCKDAQMLLRDGAVVLIGPENSRGTSHKLDRATGKVLADYSVVRRACTRTTGSVDGIFFRANEGTVRLDPAADKSQWISPMRPSCHVGVIVASGHLYWVPWACDCNLQMFGVIACGPAGEFDFAAKAVESERLESPETAPAAGPLKVAAGDWPTYRADNERSGRTSARVGGAVKLLWQTAPKAPFEPTAPTAAGGLIFLGGSDGTVRAIDAAGGAEKWRAYTGGAIVYPPSVADGRVFVGSADGWAYSLDAATGRPVWRFRAAPAERRINLYGRLASTWPVAAGVVVEGGTAYLAAGMNNFDGTYVYALDAATGRIKWQNAASGHLDEYSKRGVGVQGDMLIHDGSLFLAGGNAASPGVYRLTDGACLTPAPRPLGSVATRGRELALAGGKVTVSGQPLYSTAGAPVYDRATNWNAMDVTAADAKLSLVEAKDGAWRLAAGSLTGTETLWQQALPAPPVRWGIAVDAAGRIVVTCRDGRVLCFAPAPA